MSVTNAISGIIIIGGILQISLPDIQIEHSILSKDYYREYFKNLNATAILGAIAVILAAINVAGGFLVTNRMLAMFRR